MHRGVLDHSLSLTTRLHMFEVQSSFVRFLLLNKTFSDPSSSFYMHLREPTVAAANFEIPFALLDKTSWSSLVPTFRIKLFYLIEPIISFSSPSFF